MHLWTFIAICGIVFLVLEIFTPSLFFLNFALAAFLTAIVSVFVKTTFVLVLIFVVLSFVSFVFLRPILVRKFVKSKETGIDSKYIGQVVKAEENITSSEGVILIYGERWDARSENGEFIEKGSQVRIVRNESIIMYVEKV
ncbi:MAG: NfeD family protein [bacterium]|nr:NfeD family protein [bacterium]